MCTLRCPVAVAGNSAWRVISSTCGLWDRGFFSYDLWKEVTSRDVKILARVKSGLILQPIRNLADGSYLAKIYRTAYHRQKDRDGILVRVIRYTLDDPQRVGH